MPRDGNHGALFSAALSSSRTSCTLPRAKPPKGGDAELRDYRDLRAATSAGPPAHRPRRGWRPGFFTSERSLRMPFTFKLSQRLARMRAPTALAGTCLLALTAAACDLRPTGPGSTISRLTIVPKFVALRQNDLQDFTVVGF